MMVEETLSLCDTKFLINSKLNSGYEKKSRTIICSPSASFAAVYPVINRYILQYCDLQDSRGGKVRELLDVKTIVTNPYRRCVGGFGRNINIFFLLAEAMWIAAGHKDVEFLTIFNKRMAEFSDDGVVFHAPYGWRLRHWGVPSEGCAVNQGLDQVTAAVRFLAEDPDTRQVVMSIWNPDLDLGAVTKDKPCNDMVMLKIREGKLITTIQNRSNDLHWGLPTNIFQFSFLTELMSICLGISLGVQTHNSQSLHIYEWNEIAKNMDNEYVKSGEFDKVAVIMNYQSADDLFAALGYGETTLNKIINKLKKPEKKNIENSFHTSRRKKSEKDIVGLEGLMYSFARCCSPIPGEPIVGVVTRSKGVSVHRIDCKTLENVPPERMMDIHWSGDHTTKTYSTTIRIETAEKMGLLKDIIAAVSDNNTNINYANVKSKNNKIGIVELGIELNNIDTLKKVINSIQSIPDVYSVKRIQTSYAHSHQARKPQNNSKRPSKNRKTK